MTGWRTIGLRSWLLGAAAVAAMGAGIVGTQFRHVDIVVQGPTRKRAISFWTFRGKVKSVLQEAGVKVNPFDRVFPKLGAMVSSHPIEVQEAVPVWIKTAHRRIHVWTTQYRVQNVLDAAKIKLAPLDVVHPALNSKINTSTTINVIRRWLVTKEIAIKLPYSIQYHPDPHFVKGHSRIQTSGQYGKTIKTVQYLVQDGKTVHATLVKTQEVNRPKAEIVLYGTAPTVSRGGAVLQFSQKISMLSTAYWPDPIWSNGYTATGLKARYGVVAVDPSVIPLGSKLYIPGYGFAVAADTGGAIVGDRVDLCFNTATQALNWGIKPVEVFVLGS